MSLFKSNKNALMSKSLGGVRIMSLMKFSFALSAGKGITWLIIPVLISMTKIVLTATVREIALTVKPIMFSMI